MQHLFAYASASSTFLGEESGQDTLDESSSADDNVVSLVHKVIDLKYMILNIFKYVDFKRRHHNLPQNFSLNSTDILLNKEGPISIAQINKSVD
jgi:hypothetical protein